MHLTLGILRKSQAFFYALSFFQLDGFAVPAPAQVTQAVSTLELIGGATMLLNFFGLIGILHLMPSHTNRFLSVSTLFDRGSS